MKPSEKDFLDERIDAFLAMHPAKASSGFAEKLIERIHKEQADVQDVSRIRRFPRIFMMVGAAAAAIAFSFIIPYLFTIKEAPFVGNAANPDIVSQRSFEKDEYAMGEVFVLAEIFSDAGALVDDDVYEALAFVAE